MLRTVNLYEQLSYFEASTDFAKEIEGLRHYLLKARSNLDNQVNNLVANLHAQITSEKLPNKTGFFTGIHQWWKNLWGRNDKKNPYYWQNRIGALGRTDIDPATVEEFRMLNDLATSLTEAMEANPQPLIAKILNQWSAKLRSVIGGYMDDMINRVDAIAGKAPSAPATPATPGDSPVPPSRPAGSPALPSKKLPPDPELQATIDAWNSIKDVASEDEKEEFKKFADRKLYKDAIHYAQELLAGKKTPSKVPSAPMADIDDDEDDTPVPTPAEKPAAKSLDDEAAALGVTADTKTTFGVFGKLSDVLKKVVIDACKSSSAECPHVKKDEDDEDDVLAHLSTLDIHRILRKHDGKSIERIKSGSEAIDPTEQKVVTAVHGPWLSLTPGERKYHNDQGSLGVPLKSHNRTIYGKVFPFRIPPLLRKEDPRFNILRDYYPELFKKLNGVGRVEKPDDTPESIERRIKHAIRDGKTSGEFEVDRAESGEAKPEKAEKRREAAPIPGEGEEKGPKSKKRVGRKHRMPAAAEDEVEEKTDPMKGIPSELAGPIRKLAESNEGQAREVVKAWEAIKDEKDKHRKRRFKEHIEAGEFEEAIALAADEENDDDIKDMLAHYQPKGPTLLEALKIRLRHQREGRAEAWTPLPKKVTPKVLIERLKKQSVRLYQES